MFNVQEEISELKIQKQTIRKRRFYTSQLDKYTDEIKSLKSAGATYADIRRWLRDKKVRVAWSTIQRWYKKNG